MNHRIKLKNTIKLKIIFGLTSLCIVFASFVLYLLRLDADHQQKVYYFNAKVLNPESWAAPELITRQRDLFVENLEGEKVKVTSIYPLKKNQQVCVAAMYENEKANVIGYSVVENKHCT